MCANVVQRANRLIENIRELGSCAVALSGGVDSAVVAKAAKLALDSQAVAFTAKSPSLPSGELDCARSMAEFIGIQHEVIETDEFANELYRANGPDRCYHCKSELYSRISLAISKLGVSNIVNGTNQDDLGDYRPGLRAATEYDVHSPLVECSISKEYVRQIASYWNLPVWDKPASPCLSSRIAYGESVTMERLEMIDRAESYLRKTGVSEVRVRYHKGDLARIEVPLSKIDELLRRRQELADEFLTYGFKFVTIDLNGLQSGSLNSLIQIEMPNST